jgi:hypothetical protein
LLPEIKHAYFSIDNELFLWNYTTYVDSTLGIFAFFIPHRLDSQPCVCTIFSWFYFIFRSQEVHQIDPIHFQQPIVSVALIAARRDVFGESVHSVLAIATAIDVVLMAVCFPEGAVENGSFSGIELVPSAY